MALFCPPICDFRSYLAICPQSWNESDDLSTKMDAATKVIHIANDLTAKIGGFAPFKNSIVEMWWFLSLGLVLGTLDLDWENSFTERISGGRKTAKYWTKIYLKNMREISLQKRRPR